MDMRWCLLLALLSLAAHAHAEEDHSVPVMGVKKDEAVILNQEATRNLRPAANYPKMVPSGFRAITPSLAEPAGYQQKKQPQEEESQPARSAQQIQQDQQRKLQQQEESEELEDSEEKPDRLEILLQQSKFDCANKQSGYYADVELSCEVFHYCENNVKHSWICPEGYSFHQVYMICMLPTHDVCQKSAKYQFVNEYLYKPINEEEVQRKPHMALKYADRYFPAEVFKDERFEGKDVSEGQNEAPRRRTPRPSPRPQPAQVFRSAEEVNTPLVQRRAQHPYDFEV